MTVILLLELLARENSLGCVDDDDKLTAVNMGGELRAMLTAKNGRCLDGSLAERLICRVDHIPFAFNGFFFSHVGRH